MKSRLAAQCQTTLTAIAALEPQGFGTGFVPATTYKVESPEAPP